jgi:hypothetical protein
MAGEIGFWLYYIKLRLTVLLGVYKNSNPLSVEWRRSHWQQIKAANRRKRL